MSTEYQIQSEPRTLREQMKINRSPHDKENPYVMVRRKAVQDKQLTYEARGLLAFFLSQKDDWEFKPQDLIIQGKCTKDKVYKLLNELIAAGYLTRPECYRDDKGQFRWRGKYEVFETPQTVFPYLEKRDTDVSEEPYPENPEPGKREIKDQSNEEPSSKREVIKESLSQKSVTDVRTMIPPANSAEKTETAEPTPFREISIPQTTQQPNEPHNSNVPPVADVLQPPAETPKGKPSKKERPTLPKAIQELIREYVMEWKVATKSHWSQLNSEWLAENLLPFQVTETELRNFRRWFQWKFPTASIYGSPNILPTKMNDYRSDIRSGKFHLQQAEGEKPKINISMKEAARRAQEQGISIADVYRQVDPNYLSPEEKKAREQLR